MSHSPNHQLRKHTPARVTMRGITFVQAYDRQPVKFHTSPTLILAWSRDGEAVFALPGGGRATLNELHKQLEQQ